MEGFIPSSVKQLINRGGTISLITNGEADFNSFWLKLIADFSNKNSQNGFNKLVIRITSCESLEQANLEEFFQKKFFHTPVDHLKHPDYDNSNLLNNEIADSQKRDDEFLLTRITKPLQGGIDEINAGCVFDLDKKQKSCMLYNLGVAREFYSHVFVLIEGDYKSCFNVLLKSVSLNTLWLNNDFKFKHVKNIFSRTLKKFGDFPLVVWSSCELSKTDVSDLSNFKKCIKPYTDKTWDKAFYYNLSDLKNIANYAIQLRELLDIAIMRKNPPGAFIGFIRKFRWAAAVLLFFVLVLFPFTLKKDIFVSGNWYSEFRALKYNAFFDYVFDGKTTLQRPAKRAIHLYSAIVPNVSQVNEYIKEVLEKNGMVGKKVLGNHKIGEAIYPKKKTTLRFYPPTTIKSKDFERFAPIYDYYSSIVTDSIAYITDQYNNDESIEDRVHKGVDLGAKIGSFVIAPFSGKAYVSQSKWGGNVIVLANDYNLMFFAHCENVFYLNGQDVIKGDPMASVGLTGRTTGPHAHIGTGYLNKNGKNYIAGLRFNMIDPFVWFENGAESYVKGKPWKHKSEKSLNHLIAGEIKGLKNIEAKVEASSVPKFETSASKSTTDDKSTMKKKGRSAAKIKSANSTKSNSTSKSK